MLDENGKPLAGAKVYLREWSTYRISFRPWDHDAKDILAQVRTDASGAFAFQDVPAKPLHENWQNQNPWDVVVVAPGCAIAWRHFSAPKMNEPIALKLSREAKITGKIVDENGRPVEGIEVKVVDIAALNSELRGNFQSADRLDLFCSQLDPRTLTDAQGNGAIAGLPQGVRVQVLVEHNSYRREVLMVATTDRPQADVVDKSYDSKEKILTKTPHKVLSTNFTVELKPPYPRIIGRVTAADTGKPLPNAKVDVYGENRSFFALTDESGTGAVAGHTSHRHIRIMRISGEMKRPIRLKQADESAEYGRVLAKRTLENYEKIIELVEKYRVRDNSQMMTVGATVALSPLFGEIHPVAVQLPPQPSFSRRSIL